MKIFETLHKSWIQWNRYWFEYQEPLGLALCRIQLGLVLLWMYGVRQFTSISMFSADGMVPREKALLLMADPVRPPFGWFQLWPDAMNAPVHALLVFCCAMIVLGVATPWFGIIAWVIHMGFIQRNYAILFGADVVSCVFLFYLLFTRCDERLSVRAYFRKGPATPSALRADLSSLFARLLQIQLGVIYMYTGFEKLRGASWWDGTALWTVLGNPQMAEFNMTWVRNFPLLIAATTFVTVIFEIYWPAAVLGNRGRKLWLYAGTSFHLAIGLLLGLWPFSLVMLAPYWLWLARDAEAAVQRKSSLKV